MKQKFTKAGGVTVVTQVPSPFRERAQKLFDGWHEMGKAGLSYDPVEDLAVMCEQIETETATRCAELTKERAEMCDEIAANAESRTTHVYKAVGCRIAETAIRAEFGLAEKEGGEGDKG